jgi:type IV secretion system protein VirD4
VVSDSLWSVNGGVYFGHQLQPVVPEAWREKCILDLPWEPDFARKYEYADDRHLITFGPNGSGKTRRLLLPNLVKLTDWSCVVIDPKGKLAMQTAAWRRAHGSEVVTLDPFGTLEAQYPGITTSQPDLRSRGLNPVAMLDPASEDFADDAKKLAEALIKVEGTGETYWARSAQALVAGLLMLERLEYGQDGSLTGMRTTLTMETAALGVLLRKPDRKTGLVDKWEGEFPEIAAKLNRFTKVSSENREIMSVLSQAVTQTDWLDSRPIQRDLAAGSFDFAALKQRPVTVYLILPPRYRRQNLTSPLCLVHRWFHQRRS